MVGFSEDGCLINEVSFFRFFLVFTLERGFLGILMSFVEDVVEFSVV